MNYQPISYYLGLDLGQRSDHSALVALELAHPLPSPRDPISLRFYHDPKLRLRYIQRFPLGTPYPAIASAVRTFLRQPAFTGRPLSLTVDATGPGLPFLDFFTAQPVPAILFKVLITSGGTPHYTRGHYHVPRRLLLSNLATLIQNRRLSIAPKLVNTPDLLQELQSIQHDSRSTGEHDDIALALSLAAWQAVTANRSTLSRPAQGGF